MTPTVRMQISLPAIVIVLALLTLLVAGAGAYPTWRLGGVDGLKAKLAAGGIVLTVKVLSSALIAWRAGRGPMRAAFLYVVLGPVCVMGYALLTAAVCGLSDLSPKVMVVWLMLFYVVLSSVQCLWLVQAFRRDAFRVALGEIDRLDRPGR